MTDAFDIFGDDDSEDETNKDPNLTNDPDLLQKREQLMARANKCVGMFEPPRSVICSDETTQKNIIPKDEIPFIELPFHPPLYLGPMRVVQPENVGGNRGYVATEDLAPGTLLLVEEPIFEWSQKQIGKELGLVSIQDILCQENARDVVKSMEGLYPTLEQVDRIVKSQTMDVSRNEKIQIKEMIEIMYLQHSGSEEMQHTIQIAKAFGIELEEIDILRLLLALRYNGFGSGVYLHFAIFNHDDNANCIKFLPEKNDTDPFRGCRIYSEVRTTRYVKRGEYLTLHYLDPREVSHASRRHHLWDQHRFDVGEDMVDVKLREMELVCGVFPSSVRDRVNKERPTFDVESALSDLEQCYRHITFTLNDTAHASGGCDELLELFEQSKALEMASDELIRATRKKLKNDIHILLIRCCKLHVDSIEILMKFSDLLTEKQQTSIMQRFIQTSHFLLPLQVMYLGVDHPDIARTNYDLAMGINGMLARASDQLFQLGDEFSTFSKCQRMESMHRNEHKRIDALYPKDAPKRIVVCNK